jgi:hypothetical protein
MEDVGWGGDDDEGYNFRLTPSADTSLNSVSSASLSFGSDSDYLWDTYVIINAKVKRKGSLETGSLLPQGIIQTVTLALEEHVVERTVFFPAFTRYFLARGQSFKIALWNLRIKTLRAATMLAEIPVYFTITNDSGRRTVSWVSLWRVLICRQTAVHPACPYSGSNQNNTIKQGRKWSLWEAVIISVVYLKLFKDLF